MKLKCSIKVICPQPPNFFKIVINDTQAEGVRDIQDFSDSELKELGKEFTRLLIEKAQFRRINK